MIYKIMIVEDDAVIAQEIAVNLESWGMQTSIVQDLSQVMKKFAQYMPHLVLMDISLPFYNGYYWCRRCCVAPTRLRGRPACWSIRA